MNYGVKKAIAGTRRGFRKAGQALNDFDEAYAKKVGELIGEQNPMGMGSAIPLHHFQPGTGRADTMTDRVLGEAMNAGLGVANVASRYALPAGGAVLAAKGIADVVTGQAFGNEADQQQSGQLRM